MWNHLRSSACRKRLNALCGLAASLGVLVSPVAGGIAHADSQGYFDNFSGNVSVQYNGGALPVSVPSLKPTLDAQWAVIQAQACQQLRNAIAPSAWHTCNIASLGTLRAKQLASSSIGLKYVVSDNHLNFDKGVDGLGSWADATLDVTFDAELDLVLNVATAVDGSVPSNSGDYSNQPVSVAGATFHLTNVQINTNNVIAQLIDAVTGAFGKAEASFQSPQNVQSLVLPAVQALNAQIHAGARGLGDSIRAGNPASNWFFNLAVFVQPNQLVLQFRRDFAPAAVPQCTPPYQDTRVPGRQGVHAQFYCANTTDTLAIQMQQPGGWWNNEPTLSSDYFGSGNTKLDDANGLFQSGTYIYRVCASNMYGAGCTAASSITLDFSSSGSSGSNNSPAPSGPGVVINPHHPYLQ